MTLLILLLVIPGYWLGGQSGALMAFVLSCMINFFAYWKSDKLILKMYRARPVEPGEHRELTGMVSRIARQAELPEPRLYIVPTRAPNAFATGRDPEHAAVAVTEGLLETLNSAELEGVLGHEIAHIKNRDMLIGTITATFAGAISIIASVARWGAIFSGYGRDDNRGGGFGLLFTALLAPIIAVVLQLAISRSREYKADKESGFVTGRYLELASALEKLHSAPVRMKLDSRPATAHLMIANPLSGRGMSAIFSTHPPVEKRVAKLRELAEKAPYQSDV